MSSQLFGTARKSIVNIFSSQPVAANFHHFCVTPENFRNFGLDKSYKLLSTSFDPEANVTYVSAVEGKHYPFFGVQFHPEKNIYEWTKKENLPHSPDAIEAAQYLAMFFTDQGNYLVELLIYTSKRSIVFFRQTPHRHCDNSPAVDVNI